MAKAPQARPDLSTFLRMAAISAFLARDSAFFWWTSMMPLTPLGAAEDDVRGVEEGRLGRLLGFAAVQVGVDGDAVVGLFLEFGGLFLEQARSLALSYFRLMMKPPSLSGAEPERRRR